MQPSSTATRTFWRQLIPDKTRDMLTARGKYGLKALAHLAALPPGAMAQSADIAALQDIPKKYLDAILSELKVAGFIRAKKGPGGGYSLARQAEEISVGDAIRALDGPLAPIACASRKAYRPCDDCRDVAHCGVRLVMLQARDAMAAVLDHMSVAELRSRSGPIQAELQRDALLA